MASRERGFAFLPFLLGNWQLIVYGAVIMAVVGFVWNCERVKKDRDQIIASLKVAAVENDKRVKIAIAQAQKDKENVDNENLRLRKSNTALARSLRDHRAASGVLSGVPAPAKRPDLACFSRADYERAFGQLDKGLSELAEICDQRTIDLDTGKTWIQQVK